MSHQPIGPAALFDPSRPKIARYVGWRRLPGEPWKPATPPREQCQLCWQELLRTWKGTVGDLSVRAEWDRP
jgi:hypothetical protein